MFICGKPIVEERWSRDEAQLSWMKTRVPILIIVDSSLAINYRLHILKSHSGPGPQITFFVRCHRFLAVEKNSFWLKISGIFPSLWGHIWWGPWSWPPSMRGLTTDYAQEARIRIIWRLSRCNELAAGPKWMLARPAPPGPSALLLTIWGMQGQCSWVGYSGPREAPPSSLTPSCLFWLSDQSC